MAGRPGRQRAVGLVGPWCGDLHSLLQRSVCWREQLSSSGRPEQPANDAGRQWQREKTTRKPGMLFCAFVAATHHYRVVAAWRRTSVLFLSLVRSFSLVFSTALSFSLLLSLFLSFSLLLSCSLVCFLPCTLAHSAHKPHSSSPSPHLFFFFFFPRFR